MHKQNNIVLACLSLLIGGLLSSFLLPVQFGQRIYSYRDWQFLAPSTMVFGPSRIYVYERLIDYTFDAIVFGAIFYIIVLAVIRPSKEEKYR